MLFTARFGIQLYYSPTSCCWVRCAAPASAGTCGWPRAAPELDAQGSHRRGRYLRRGGRIWCAAFGGPVPAAGPRAADRLDVQGGHRRSGRIWCTAPGGPVPAAGPRAAAKLDVQCVHQRGGWIRCAAPGRAGTGGGPRDSKNSAHRGARFSDLVGLEGLPHPNAAIIVAVNQTDAEPDLLVSHFRWEGFE